MCDALHRSRCVCGGRHTVGILALSPDDCPTTGVANGTGGCFGGKLRVERPRSIIVVMFCETAAAHVEFMLLPAVAAFTIGSCFAALYVKWLEASGLLVVPIAYNIADSDLDYLMASLNGIFFTGGDLLLTPDIPYYRTARKIFDKVRPSAWRWLVTDRDHPSCAFPNDVHLFESATLSVLLVEDTR